MESWKKWAWMFLFLSSQKILNVYGYGNGTIVWCNVNSEEQKKCFEFSEAVNKTSRENKLVCHLAPDKEQCMNLIDLGKADLMILDPGEIYTAGRYNSLIPIMAERYGVEEAYEYYTVAVIHKDLNINSLHDLKNKRACFPGVGQMAGWVIPIATLIDKDIIVVKDCNNLVKTAAAFFGSSCAPNSLIDKFNPSGDNPLHMCDLCIGDKSSHCSGNDPYANFDGAFNCLSRGADIAFLKHTTVDEMTSSANYRGPSKNMFKLLCPNGYTDNIDAYHSCNWGKVPAHAVVTSSAVPPEGKKSFIKFLLHAVSKFSGVNRQSRPWGDESRLGYTSHFQLFGNNGKYERKNLLFQDLTTNLMPLEENQQTFNGYLGNLGTSYQMKLQKCPIPSARFCAVSDQEWRKCQKMKTAFRAKMLKPDLVCIKGFSQMKCMQLIKDNSADLVVLDAGDIYHAGQHFNLIPIISEQYDLDEPVYYAIAVARQSDKETDLLYLKGKRSCHPGIGTAAGWVIPISFLLASDRMRGYGCNSEHAAAEFFQKSCVPGALSREYSVNENSDYNVLCGLCHGSSSYFCSKTSQEPFYGHTGALRCLVEGGGHIAFVKHTTILENTAGKNPEFWSRPMMPDDFELLCRDGTRAAFDQYKVCNLGKVASNAIVTSKFKPKEYIDAYIDLFLYAQQYYGSKFSEEFTFKLFVSEDSYTDLIFQDATQQLKVVPESKRHYRDYLGDDFLQAMRAVDCTASSSFIKASVSLIIFFVSIQMFITCSDLYS